MIRDGIEVWGYRRNYEKAQEAYENGHVDGVTVDIKTLVQTVKSGWSWYLHDGCTSRNSGGHSQ